MKPLIVANWKMNPESLKKAELLFNSMKKGLKNMKGVNVVVCPPFLYLPNLKCQMANLKLGAQNCFWEEKGAFTGEISPTMLKNLNCDYLILGHSERRKFFNETNGMVDKKMKLALKNKIKPILCIDKVSQIKKDLKPETIIAYEPLFAIGTGKACSTKKAKKVRESLSKFKTVLYGGSVNPENAASYIKEAGFQGLLVGGASLDSKKFLKIIKNTVAI